MNKYWGIREEVEENKKFLIWGFHDYIPITFFLSIFNNKYDKDNLINFLNTCLDSSKSLNISSKINLNNYNLDVFPFTNLQKNSLYQISSDFNQLCFMYSYSKNNNINDLSKTLTIENLIMNTIDLAENIFKELNFFVDDHTVKMEKFIPIILNY
jgi:hypothetical protein